MPKYSGFELMLVGAPPPIGLEDMSAVARIFLRQIGYLPGGKEGTIAYNLFVECLMKHKKKAWSVDELSAALQTSRTTVYRHLNKLKKLDILEEVPLENIEGEVKERGLLQGRKKAYRLRYGNLEQAWTFVEAHAKLALQNYRKTVNHFQALVDKEEEGDAKA
jgi:DNA-binding transcriptional ArsR family regulator